jgi:hypothetical protein
MTRQAKPLHNVCSGLETGNTNSVRAEGPVFQSASPVGPSRGALIHPNSPTQTQQLTSPMPHKILWLPIHKDFPGWDESDAIDTLQVKIRCCCDRHKKWIFSWGDDPPELTVTT